MDSEIQEVKAMIEAALPVFLAKHCALMTTAEHAALQKAIEQKMPLDSIRIRVHQCLVRISGSIPGFDSRLFWALIDAINFWSDVESHRWPYQTADGQKQYLVWARENAQLAIA